MRINIKRMNLNVASQADVSAAQETVHTFQNSLLHKISNRNTTGANGLDQNPVSHVSDGLRERNDNMQGGTRQEIHINALNIDLPNDVNGGDIGERISEAVYLQLKQLTEG